MIRTCLLVLALCVSAVPAIAQAQGMTRVPAQVDEAAIPLYDPEAIGASTEIWTSIGTERWVRNVNHPTLLPVLPDPEKANGAAVIIVPGGAFQFVSIDNEGYPIADWLAEQGVAAFVLKYRVMETPEAEEALPEHIQRIFAPTPDMEPINAMQGIPAAVEDAQAALRLVEARSESWGIDTDRIGMLGFSAGAITTMAVTLDESDAPKPDFIGHIYGPMTSVDVPADAPPLFTALAADDSLFGQQGFGLVDSWVAAGKPVELHFYQNGGHGFGSYKRGATADAWFDKFVGWMTARGLMAPQDQE